MKSNGLLIAIIGPSGTGKSTIVRKVHERTPMVIIPTWTDRPKRKGETDFEHRFISGKRFTELQSKGFFDEVITPFQLKFRYGFKLHKLSDAMPSLIMLRVDVLERLFEYYSHENTIVIQIESHRNMAEKHVRNRQNGVYGSRISQFEDEIRVGRKAADYIFHHTFSNTDELASNIIRLMN